MDLAETEGLSLVVTSQHLRLLHECGLLQQARKSKWIFYSPDVDPEPPMTRKIYNPLKKQLISNEKQIENISKIMTGFTHPRRIEIVKQLHAHPRTFDELTQICSISPGAMHRHLNKLISRKFIREKSGVYILIPKGTELKKMLISICHQSIINHTS
jgi:DNA-binding transcriptional ArsR family regulator